MGINISGLLVKGLDVSEDQAILEDLFECQITAQRVVEWEYHNQLERIGDNEIAIVSNGMSSALYLGGSLLTKASRLFSKRTEDRLPHDYLFFSFSETTMFFLISHYKAGKRYDEIHDNGKKVHGENVIGLQEKDDIAQDGLYKALKEFNLVFDTCEALILTIKATPKTKAESEKQLGTDDQRFQILSYSVYLMKLSTGQIQRDPRKDNQYQRHLNDMGVQLGSLSFSKEKFDVTKKYLKGATLPQLNASRRRLLDAFFEQGNKASCLQELVYVQKLIQDVNNGVESKGQIWWSIIKLAISVLLSIGGIISVLYVLFR